MAQEYASKQPQGYKNYVENIAIVGAGGQVGQFIVAELVKTGKHKVTAITRTDSTSKVPDGVTAAKVDYDDPSTLVKALQGIEVLIITMGVQAPPEQQTKLIHAAAEAGVPWVIPNEWGPDGANESLSKEILLGEKQTKYRGEIERIGKSSWIGIACSFWYEYSLSGGVETYGFDLKDKSVTFIDDGNTKINTSTWPQCGRGIASLLGLKVLPDDESDKSPHLAQFRNRFVYWSSFRVSQKDMLDSILRVTGDKLEDWTISHQNHKERWQSGMDELQKGNRLGFIRVLYTRVFYPNGDGDFETKRGLQNEILGLPMEDLDESTRGALKRAEENRGLDGKKAS